MQPNATRNDRFDNQTERLFGAAVAECREQEFAAWEEANKTAIAEAEQRLLNEHDESRRAAMREVSDRFDDVTEMLAELPFWTGPAGNAKELAIGQVTRQYYEFCRLEARRIVRDAQARGEAA
jgi:hypothetical protein